MIHKQSVWLALAVLLASVLIGGLAWALLQQSPCVPVTSGKALALSCAQGYEPRR
jgi:hypothetical protein